MSTEPDEAETYCVGGLEPEEAARLIEALERAGIDFHTQLQQEPPSVELEGDSPHGSITIAIDAASVDAVRRIEAELFGNKH